MKTDHVYTETKDNIILHGLYQEGDKDKPVVILIHGFISDFYSDKFLQVIQKKLADESYASISIQTRGTGIRTAFLEKGRISQRWIGSFYEILDEAHLDISAWIKFLKSEGYRNVILAGHSLGTIKVVRYLFEGDRSSAILKLVLLAPFDKNGYLEKLTKGKWKDHLIEAKKQLKAGNGENIIPDYFDDVPTSYQTYVSWYDDTDLNNIWDFYRSNRYDSPILKQIAIPVSIIVGDQDEYFYLPEFSSIKNTKNYLEKNFNDLEINFIEGCDHYYVGYEDKVSDLVFDFCSEK